MVKIYINNEEVVANQNFTINKHMLNTPSVILNNVCPKSWCENKDYSNFYHPQDYSKCKIQDETYIPAEPGIYTTINGSATIQNVDTSKLQEVTQLDGDTTQDGTPTPTSPQPINVVSGRQEVNVLGKNIFDYTTSTFSDPYRVNITTEDNTITMTTTATTTSGNLFFYTKIPDNTLENGATYTISSENVSGVAQSLKLQLRNKNGTSANKPQVDSVVYDDTYSLYVVRNIFATNNQTSIPAGTTAIIKNVMVEKSSTPTSYEAYTGQSYEINLGKNLLDIDGLSGTSNNVDYSVSNGKLVLNGTLNSDRIEITLSNKLTIQGTYTFSKNYASTIALKNSSYASVLQVNRNLTEQTATVNSTITKIVIYQTNGTVFDNVEVELQVEKGTKTSYAPYKTPIELCKIGDYKDRIYKDNGTWYLHKEIGKVVFNGSENWNGASGNAYIVLNDTIRTNAISNYFMYSNSETTYGYMKWSASQPWLVFYGGITQHTNLAGWKTWLSTHNTTVYYILSTPTYTEITDTELISQLEAISLINGLNNVSISSPYLTAPITIHYNFVNEETIIDLLFCGVVKNSGKISLNPREPHLTTLQILDFKDFLSSGETLDYVIYQKTILEAIQQVINSISDYGFVLGNINILNPNEVIGAYSTKDKTAYDVFNYIADITQSRWTTRMVDENTVAIDFYDPTLMTQGTAIDYTQSYFENNLIDDMKYNYGTNNYRNKQIMVSNQVIGNLAQIQTLYSNGYQDQYIVDLPIAQIDSIYVDGEKKEVATEEDKYLGINADFYYSVNSNVIESEKIYTASSKIEINYVPVIEGRQVITNNDEISRINTSTGRKGIVSRYEQRNDATTLLELQKIGESYIKYKGTPEIVLTIDSRKNLWEVGQRVQFNAPVDELDTEYMVRTKKINYIVSVDTLFYTYELVSSFNSETEINYFDNQRAKSKGNIGDGEYISRNIDIENVANVIFYDTTATEITLTGDNTLNSILNSPFID